VAPEWLQWLRAHVPSEWVERYDQRMDDERLPRGEEKRRQYAEQVGTDGWAQLTALESAHAPSWLQEVAVVD